ncbi:MAG: hypothetical protein ACYC2Y_00450 [Armatimonadota bacterium]
MTSQEKPPITRPQYQHISVEAQELADKYGLSADRIIGILKRTIQEIPDHVFQISRPNRQPLPKAASHICLPSLREALQYMPPDAALKLFENENLEELAKHQLFVFYVGQPHAPLYTLDELAYTIDQFIQYLKGEEQHLLMCGSPKQRFSGSLWLNMLLGRAYPFEPETTSAEPIQEFVTPIKFGHVRRKDLRFADLGLSDEQICRLQVLRPKYMQLKVDMLLELLHAIKKQSGTIWDTCLDLLTKALTGDDAEFMLEIDQLYLTRMGISEGGLSKLLTVVGYVEEELSIGLIHTTREKLGDLAKVDRSGQLCLGIPSYFAAVGCEEQAILECASQVFHQLSTDEAAFWQRYTDKVHLALQEEFYEDTLVPVRVKRKACSIFKPYIRKIAGMATAYYDARGEFPAVDMEYRVRQVSRKEYAFVQEGAIWSIDYKGKHFSVPHYRGMGYIHYLLEHPYRSFTPSALRAATGQLGPGNQTYSGMNDEQLGEEGLYGMGTSEDEPSYEDVQVYEDAIAELDEQLYTAGISGDIKAAEDIIAKQQKLKAILKSDKRRLYRPRSNQNAGDDAERGRKAVSNAIDRALTSIGKHDHELWLHLSNSIKKGADCAYRPEEECHWET